MAEVVRDPRLLPFYLTPREAAGLLRRSIRTLQEYCKAGDLRRGEHWIQPKGRVRLFVRDAILAYQRETEVRGPVIKSRSRSRYDLSKSPTLQAAYARQNGL